MTPAADVKSGPNGAGPSLSEGGERSGEGAVLHRAAVSRGRALAARVARKRGAALLTAMIIVALVATLAGSMIWQQWRAIQVEAAERARSQSAWILSGALDWARLILREDARNGGIDHLGEPWAVPLAEARLSTFLAADKDNTDDAPDAFLSGAITDAVARYNLTNLVTGNRIDPLEMATLQRLCETVGVSADVATRIAVGDPRCDAAAGGRRRGQRRERARAAGEANAAPYVPPADPPLMPASVRQLAWVGIDPEALRALEPYVVILPEKAWVNVNTAPREVLVAAIAGLDLGDGGTDRPGAPARAAEVDRRSERARARTQAREPRAPSCRLELLRGPRPASSRRRRPRAALARAAARSRRRRPAARARLGARAPGLVNLRKARTSTAISRQDVRLSP